MPHQLHYEYPFTVPNDTHPTWPLVDDDGNVHLFLTFSFGSNGTYILVRQHGFRFPHRCRLPDTDTPGARQEAINKTVQAIGFTMNWRHTGGNYG